MSVGKRKIRASTKPLREYSFIIISDASFAAPYALSGVAIVSGMITLGRFPPYTANEDVKMNLIKRPTEAPWCRAVSTSRRTESTFTLSCGSGGDRDGVD